MPEFSSELTGARAGDILKFNGTAPEGSGEHAGKEISFQVLVKEVKAKRLPADDDDFAKTASEFDTIEELRDDIRERVRRLKENEVKAVVRDRVLTQLVGSVDAELPDSLVDRETERHVRDLERKVERAGLTMEQALGAQGWDELRFRSDARTHAIRDLKAELALEAIARREELEATDQELDAEVQALAKATKRDPKQVRRLLERSGEIASLTGDIIRSKALDLVVDRADVVSKDESAAADQADPSEGTEARDPAESALSQPAGGTE
jgi:trigger factor